MNIEINRNQILTIDDSYLNENWKYYTMDFHSHGFLELNYIIDGSCSYIVGNTTYQLKKRNLLLINSSIPHKKVFDHTTPCSILGCSFAFCENSPLEAPFSAILKTNPSLFKFISEFKEAHIFPDSQSIFNDMDTINEQFHQEQNDYYLFTLTNKILFSLTNMRKASDTLSSTYILQIQHYVKDHYYKIKSVEDISACINLNKTYLERIFKKEMNITLWNYVMNYKMEAAKNLLLHPEIPIGEIDYLIGMNSRQAFYLQFKKRYKISPSEFRKSLLEGN